MSKQAQVYDGQTVVAADLETQVPAISNEEAQTGGLMNLVQRMALDKEIDPIRIDQAFEMYRKVREMDAESAFNQAMSAAQAEMQPVVANMRNDHTSKNYADLSAIHKALKPVWTKHGLSFSAKPLSSDLQGHVRVSVTLRHAAGHSERSEFDFPLDTAGTGGRVNKTQIQGIGSSFEYGRRYLELLMMDISVEGKDNDGNAPRNQNPAEQPLTKAQIDNLRNAMQAAGISDQAFCEKAQIEKVEDLPQGRLQGSIQWLKKVASK